MNSALRFGQLEFFNRSDLQPIESRALGQDGQAVVLVVSDQDNRELLVVGYEDGRV